MYCAHDGVKELDIFLDTNALNPFVGITVEDAHTLSSLLTETKSSIRVCHLQIDEKYPSIKEWNEKAEKIILILSKKGLVINQIPSACLVIGVTRVGMGKTVSVYGKKMYNDLISAIDQCERARAIGRGEEYKKSTRNISIDANIGVTALDNDVFITCDRCLKESLDIVIKENEEILKVFSVKIPKIIWKDPRSDIVKEIIDLLKSEFSH